MDYIISVFISIFFSNYITMQFYFNLFIKIKQQLKYKFLNTIKKTNIFNVFLIIYIYIYIYIYIIYFIFIVHKNKVKLHILN